MRSLSLRRGDVGRAMRPTLLTPAFLTVAAAELAYFTADGVLLPAVPRYVAGPLGGGDAAVGLVVGIWTLAAFLLRPLAGRLGDRRGRRAVMVLGASLFAASIVGYLAAPSIPVLIGARLLSGAGEALFFVAAFAATVDLAPAARRGEAISFASLSLYLGIGIGPFLGEAAIGLAGFPGAWVLAIGLGAAAALLSTRLPALVPEGTAEGPQRLIDRRGLLPGLVLLSMVLGMAGFLAFVPLYALDLGMAGAGPVLGLFGAIVVGIRSLGARIPDRVGAGRTTRISLVAGAVGLATAGLWREPTGLVMGAAVLAVGVALFTPGLMSLAMEGVAPNARGAVMGTTTAFLDLAFGLGPATLGVLAAAAGRPGTFLAGAGVALLGLGVVQTTRLGRSRA
mgnify:FL=1